MNLKENFQRFKDSKLVEGTVEKLSPTWEVVKNRGGYKIILISALVTLLFIPVNFIIGFLSTVLVGTSIVGGASFNSIIENIAYGNAFQNAAAIINILGFILIAALLSIITFIVTTFLITNANFRAFKILAEEDRVVNVGEYFKLSVVEIFSYAWKYLLNIMLPIFVISVIGSIINIIPFVKGISIANFLIAILTYALMFRFIAILLGKNHEEAVNKFSPYWLTYALVVYLVKMATTLDILVTVLEFGFILYSVLILTGSKYYFNEEIDINI